MAQSRLRNFQSCCRLCLCEKMDTLKSVFEEVREDGSLPQKILQFVDIEIKTSDKITMVCNKCIAKIDNWHKYKIQCIRNQSKLDERLNSGPTTNIAHMSFHIKEEFLEKSVRQTENDTVDVKNEYIDSSDEPMEEEYNELPPPLTPHPPDSNQDSENSQNDRENQQDSLNTQQASNNSLRLNSETVEDAAGPKTDSKYSCKLCDKVYSRYGGIWAHNKKKHPEKKSPLIEEFPKQCKLCDKIYQSGAAYFRHKRVHEKERLTVEGGEVTPIKVKSTKEYQKEEGGSYHNCEYCFKVFSSRYNLRNHMKSHEGKSNPSSEKVDKKVKPIGNKVAKPAVLEGEPPIFTCDECSTTFTTKRALRRHREKHAQKTKPLVPKQVNCKYCKMAFDSSTLLTEHMRLEHEESAKPKGVKTKEKEKPRQFPCTKCKKVFPTATALTAHIGWHKRSSPTDDLKSAKTVKQNKIIDKLVKNIKTKQKPIDPPQFQCTTCLIVFPNDTALQVHILEKHRSVSEIMLIPRCNICSKDFPAQDEYETHKRLHDFLERQKHQEDQIIMQETPPKKNPSKEGSVRRSTAAQGKQTKGLPCQYCPAVLSRSDTLKGHIRRYHKEYLDSEFECTQCDRVFDKRNSLSIHLKVHEKQRSVAKLPAKTFSCSICSMGFDLPSDLREHTVSAHPF